MHNERMYCTTPHLASHPIYSKLYNSGLSVGNKTGVGNRTLYAETLDNISCKNSTSCTHKCKFHISSSFGIIVNDYTNYKLNLFLIISATSSGDRLVLSIFI